jgi:hypothetical protein
LSFLHHKQLISFWKNGEKNVKRSSRTPKPLSFNVQNGCCSSFARHRHVAHIIWCQFQWSREKIKWFWTHTHAVNWYEM